MFDRWLIDSATARLHEEDIPTDGSVLPLIIGLLCRKNELVYYSSVNAGLISRNGTST